MLFGRMNMECVGMNSNHAKKGVKQQALFLYYDAKLNSSLIVI
jgi:hypothetical protein